MKHAIPSLSRNIPAYGKVFEIRGKELDLWHKSQIINCMEDRLLVLQTQAIVDDFTAIAACVKEFDRLWLWGKELLQQIHDVLFKLQSETKNYAEMVGIITKYMSQIRICPAPTDIGDVVFYKRLLESVMVAIGNELKHFENLQF